MLRLCEQIARIGEVEPRAHDQPDLARSHTTGCCFGPHSFGTVPEPDGMIPNFSIRVRIDAVFAPVKNERNKGLGDTEVPGNPLLGYLGFRPHGGMKKSASSFSERE